MKKSYSLTDDMGAAPFYDFGDGAATPAPAAASNDLIFDDGEPFTLATTTTSVSVSAGSAKPVATVATLADYLINGFWQYNSSIAHHWASSTITYNISGLNAAEQFLAQSALQAWHDVANVSFVLTTAAANITFVDTGSMQAVTNASWYGNGAMASANVDISSDWITNDGGAMDGKTGIDSYGYQTYIHEIGHALGLGHQGPYNGSAVYSTNALYADDTWQYSIMSYFAQNNYSGSTYRYVVSPQVADIYAVGQMYGAATTTRTGDTIYGFHSNAGAVYDFSAYTRAPALTIYDSGGNDTLDCSGYSVAQTIDLHAGAFSSVGGLVNNIGIALGANIETAIGGSGNDTLIANDNGCTLMGGAGNDTLVGGAGVDFMTGGSGADTFVFASGGNSAASGHHDRITDFTVGLDKIDLSMVDGNSTTAAHDVLHFIGTSGFDGGVGELDYSYNSTLGVTTLLADTNGDRAADFAIDVTGNIVLSLSDFIGVAAVNHAPVLTLVSGTVAASAGQSLSASSLFSATDADNDTLSYYLFDNTTDPSSGHFSVNGTAVAAGAMYAVSAAQLAQLTFVAGASGSSDDLFVEAFDGQTISGWSEFHVNVASAPNHAPVLTLTSANLAATAGQSLTASSLFSATDADHDTLSYFIFDNSGDPNSGYFSVNGTAVAAGNLYGISAAQLAQTTFVAGASGSSDDLFVEAYDGQAYSGWSEFHVNVASAPNHAPVLTLTSANVATTAGQSLTASSLFSAADADHDTLSYFVFDNSPDPSSGHFSVNGATVTAGGLYAVSAAQLSQTTFVAGTAGSSDDLFVEAFDGQAYSGWSEFHVNVAASNSAPVVSLVSANVSATAGQSIAASALFGATDADHDTLSYFVFDNSPAVNSGHFSINGTTVPPGMAYAISAAQLAQTSFVAGAAGTSDDLFVEAYDGHVYSGWSEFHVLV